MEQSRKNVRRQVWTFQYDDDDESGVNEDISIDT